MADVDPLVAFIRARLAEDVAVAEAATPGLWRTEPWCGFVQVVSGTPPVVASVVADSDRSADAEHIARWHPARALAEAAAKTAILDLHGADLDMVDPRCRVCGPNLWEIEQMATAGVKWYDPPAYPCKSLLALAAVWRVGPDGAQHPDWQESWNL